MSCFFIFFSVLSFSLFFVPSSFLLRPFVFCFFFFNDTATTEIYTLSLHDALPIYANESLAKKACQLHFQKSCNAMKRSEEHTSELQSPDHLVCRLLLEKKKKRKKMRRNKDEANKKQDKEGVVRNN